MFYSCDLLLSFLEPKNDAHRGLCQDVGMLCNFIAYLRRGHICITYILRGDNLQILHHSWAVVQL